MTFSVASAAGRCGLVVALLCMGGTPLAAPLTVTVADREGRPVPDVVVYLEAADATPSAAPAGTTAIMDQVNLKFEPHILVVQAGTSVAFPNSDTVAHHVYSFSRPNEFALPIYKGNIRAPVVFRESGIAVLGCNIHDDMLGYILVVDTPWFGKTDDAGRVVLDAHRQGPARVVAWSPRIRDDAGALSVTVAGEATVAEIHLEQALRPDRRSQSEALSWSDY